MARNLGVLAAGEILTRLLTFVAIVHLARVLKPDLFGLLEVALAVMMLCTLCVDQGFPTLGAREVARKPQQIASLVRRFISAQMLLALGTAALLVVALVLLPIPRTLKWLLGGFGVSLLGVPFQLVWVFQGQGRMAWVAIPQIVRQLVFAAVVLLLIHSSDQVLLVPLAEFLAVGAAALLMVMVYRGGGRRLGISLRRGWDSRLFLESLPIGGSQMIWVFRMYLPVILLGALSGQAAVGLFGAAHRIVMVIQTLLGVYFINLFPTMSQASQQSCTRLRDLLHRSMPLVIWPAALLALITVLGAPMVISLVFGEDYLRQDSASVLAVLIWIIPILAWRRHLRSALIVLSRQREDFVCSLAGLVLLVPLLVWLTGAYGLPGAAWAMVISELFAAGLTGWRLGAHLPGLRLLRSLFSVRAMFRMPVVEGQIDAPDEIHTGIGN